MYKYINQQTTYTFHTHDQYRYWTLVNRHRQTVHTQIPTLHTVHQSEMQRCGDAKMGRCRDAQMQRCGDAEMRRCIDVRMHGCKDAWMRGCTDARMHGCMDAWMRGCVIILIDIWRLFRKSVQIECEYDRDWFLSCRITGFGPVPWKFPGIKSRSVTKLH